MISHCFLLLLCGLVLGEARTVPFGASRVYPRSVNTTNYDFIIVGGGVSGLTVADRLTENPSINVLVIEAGQLDDGREALLVPGKWSPAHLMDYFWPMMQVEPLTALDNQVQAVTCGRVVGGGSTVNAMNWLRGTSYDHDGWVALGNDGWGWNDLLPYFKKSENFGKPDPAFAAANNITWDDSVHGFDGPVAWSYPTYHYPSATNFWNAAMSVGIPEVHDPFAGSNSGIFNMPIVLNKTSETRCDARTAHYDRVIDSRPNYHLMTETLVSKILFDGNKAIGVEFVPASKNSTGYPSRAYVSKEVLVAAGGIHTPQVLQLSGVGPKSLLDSFNIPVVSDLPGVGTNLQDNAILNITYTFDKKIEPNAESLVHNDTFAQEQWENYQAHLGNAFTIVTGSNTQIVSLALSHAMDDISSILNAAQSNDAAASLPADTDPTVLAGYKAQREVIIANMQNPNISFGGFSWNTVNSVQVNQVASLSRGTIKINSTDVTLQPVLDYRSLTDPVDFMVLVAMYRKFREVINAPDMAVLGPHETTPYAGATTDDEIMDAIKQTIVISSEHQCCTAPMMPLEKGGVVDTQHRVYGTTNLRVLDVSAMPMAVSGGPTPTMYASGEKLADMIKLFWGIT
ncbi:hypothetical protein F5Y15DRAFT_72209 [Xylariaceae sp. FL0016]|nr:hypothetical protein F5Y15DRAFT_72209 [Xylariaceae sp. FL0016]